MTIIDYGILFALFTLCLASFIFFVRHLRRADRLPPEEKQREYERALARMHALIP